MFPVIQRHERLRSDLTCWACLDLAHVAQVSWPCEEVTWRAGAERHAGDLHEAQCLQLLSSRKRQ